VSSPTDLQEAPPALCGANRVFLKREDLHELGAFKWRGALPTLEAFRRRGAKAVVTASTGNHGAAVAWAARRTGARAVVYAPRNASESKLDLIQAMGAEIRLVGDDLDFAKDEARRFAAESGVPFFEDGAEPTQLEGYGAITDEILDQLPSPPTVVVVPVGNGALIGGIGLALGRRAPGARLMGVCAKEAPVMALSFDAGRPVVCDRMRTFADGLAVRVAIPSAVALVDRVADSVVTVSEREIARAIGAFAREGIRVEGAAAAGGAALARMPAVGGPVVVVVTGRNIDEELFRRAVERPESFPD